MSAHVPPWMGARKMVCRLYHSPQGRARIFATGFHGRAWVVPLFIRTIRGSCFFSREGREAPRGLVVGQSGRGLALHALHTGINCAFAFGFTTETRRTQRPVFLSFFSLLGTTTTCLVPLGPCQNLSQRRSFLSAALWMFLLSWTCLCFHVSLCSCCVRPRRALLLSCFWLDEPAFFVLWDWTS